MSEINDALVRLLKRYTPTPVSPCPVCGSPRSFASIGGGDAPVVVCDNARKPDGSMDWEHYQRSRAKFFGVGDSEVVELVDAYRNLEAGGQARAQELRSELDLAAEAADILRNLITSIERHGNYSEETTLNFLRQALGCISRFEDTSGIPATPCRHEFTDDGQFKVACCHCNLQVDATPSNAVLEHARQAALETPDDDRGNGDRA